MPIAKVAPLVHVSRCLIVWAAGAACHLPAVAQSGTGDWNGPLILQATPQLQEQLTESDRAQRPAYISGDRMEGEQESHVRVQGDAQLRRADTLITADQMEYFLSTQQAHAQGNVRINNAGDIYQGSQLELNVSSYRGYFEDVHYHLRENLAHGAAKRVDFQDQDNFLVHEGDYTTCQRVEHDPEWVPAWQIRARELTLDRVADVGVARGAYLDFMGVPILPVPYISFPLSDKRKSGFLPPTIGLDSVSGFQYEQPYYWNIAPNYDATLTTSLLARRGVNFGGEFRYLQPSFNGELAARWMPDDRLRNEDRWSVAMRHRHTVDTAVGDVAVDVNLNRVSDNNYWRDFPRSSYGLTERLLPNELNAHWRRDDWRVRLRTLKWQTLQDADSIILPPYDMLPQLNVRYAPWEIAGGMDFSMEFDATRFRADRDFRRQQLTDGDRAYALLKLSRPFIAPQGFITPAVQLHASQYQLSGSLTGRSSYSRVLPTYSIDSGLVFERDTQLFGRSLLQTLEPRAFYTYTPYRDQSMLPMYDSAELDFTFASIYSPNAFVGHDRIADNNLMTLGLTSRFIAPETGAELARASVAQRLRFKDQKVTAPGVDPLDERWSDILLGGAINWTPRWSTNGVIQYNYKARRSIRYTLAGYYRPGEYRVLSAGYRMKRDASKHVELGWQWPLSNPFAAQDAGLRDISKGGRWYTVGRLNYSMRDKKFVDTVVGVEYNGCCWIGRVVLERLQNSYSTSNTRLLVQLELVGLSRINLGSNPLNSLRSNVPYYQEVQGQQTGPTSRFSHYE